jgi:hypothetical protein
MGRLILLAEATLDPTPEHLLELARYCLDQEYTALALYASAVCVAKKDNGDSRLQRGLARHQANLRSLAFEDYRAAAKYGVSVAKSNMAALLSGGPVAEAGLEILRDHSGEFNCVDPGQPYEVRMGLERSVEKERKVAQSLFEYGDRIVKALHRLVESWLRARTAQSPSQVFWKANTSSHEWIVSVEGGHVSTAVLDGKLLTVQAVHPLKGFYIALEGSTVRLLFVIGGDFEAVAVDGLAAAGKLEWFQFRPSAEEDGP